MHVEGAPLHLRVVCCSYVLCAFAVARSASVEATANWRSGEPGCRLEAGRRQGAKARLSICQSPPRQAKAKGNEAGHVPATAWKPASDILKMKREVWTRYIQKWGCSFWDLRGWKLGGSCHGTMALAPSHSTQAGCNVCANMAYTHSLSQAAHAHMSHTCKFAPLSNTSSLG